MELSFHTQVAGRGFTVAEAVGPMADAGMLKVESRSRAIDWLGAERRESVRETAAALKATGVELYAVHSPFGDDVDWCSHVPCAAGEAQEAMRFVIAASADLGATVVTIHPSRGPEGESAQTMAGRVRGGLEALLPAAGSAEVKLALENMPWAGQAATDLVPIIAGLGSPSLVACLDTGHAHMVGGVTESLLAFGVHLGHLHIHDNHGSADEHLTPPNGTVDWPGFITALREAAFQGPLNFELRPAADQGMTLLQTREHLGRMFQ